MAETLYDIFGEYDARRGHAERTAQVAREEAFSRSPRLRELLEARQDVLLSQLREVLQHPADKAAIQAWTEAQVKRLNEQIRREAGDAGISLSALEPQFRCPDCRDTGLLGEGREKRLCPCLKEQVYVRVLGGEEIARLEGGAEAFDESIFSETSGAREQIRKIRRFMEGYAAKYPENPHSTMVLLGKAGLGKSFMLAYLAKELQKKERDILYIRSGSLFGLFHRHRLGEFSRVDLIYDAAVLLIDDLGTEPGHAKRDPGIFSLSCWSGGRPPDGLQALATNLDETMLRGSLWRARFLPPVRLPEEGVDPVRGGGSSPAPLTYSLFKESR